MRNIFSITTIFILTCLITGVKAQNKMSNNQHLDSKQPGIVSIAALTAVGDIARVALDKVLASKKQ